MKILFWLSLFGTLYSYAIYPLILQVLVFFQPRVDKIPKGSMASTEWPTISHIIAAHNEQARIEEKIRNALSIDYPSDRYEIIVASDYSTDATNNIVQRYAAQGVKLVQSDEHNGKEYTQWLAIQRATGTIIIFSDTATNIPADGFKKLILEFSDPRVGAVSSEDRFITENGKIAGEGAYVRYEMWLRQLESAVAGLVGLSGSFFAARREICSTGWDVKSPSDFNTALNCNAMGFRAVSSNNVLGYYRDVKDSKKEYQRKVRTVIRGITSITRHPSALNLFESGFFGFQVWSHKIMRWAVPWFMTLLFITNWGLLGNNWFYTLCCIGQIIGYAAIASAWFKPSLQQFTPFRLGLFFVQVNLAIAHATIAFLSGRRMTVWTPSQR